MLPREVNPETTTDIAAGLHELLFGDDSETTSRFILQHLEYIDGPQKGLTVQRVGKVAFKEGLAAENHELPHKASVGITCDVEPAASASSDVPELQIILADTDGSYARGLPEGFAALNYNFWLSNYRDRFENRIWRSASGGKYLPRLKHEGRITRDWEAIAHVLKTGEVDAEQLLALEQGSIDEGNPASELSRLVFSHSFAFVRSMEAIDDTHPLAKTHAPALYDSLKSVVESYRFRTAS